MTLFWQFNRPLLKLALPLLGAYLAQAGIGVIDTLMAGRYSAVDLAAVAVGLSVFTPLSLLIMGTLLATTPLTAQARGAQKLDSLSNVIRQALWVGLALVILCSLVMFHAHRIFDFMGVTPQIADLSSDYLRALIWGMPALACFQVLRCLSEGMNHVRPVLMISLAGLLLNIPANYVLIYGKLGFPALGAVGCGYATAICFWFMAAMLALYVHRQPLYASLRLFASWQGPQWPMIRTLLWIGVPIGLSIFVEASLFTTIALLIGSMGEIVVAGHQIAFNFTGLVFMVPLSLGMALTVMVGHALGEGKPDKARLAAFYGLLLSLCLACCSALITWLLSGHLVKLYTPNTEVQLLAMGLIKLAAFYQISDALQINAAGALRGYRDTRIIMLITLVSYWCIGLGGGWYLALGPNPFGAMGVQGFWIGLIMGLSCAALLLLWRLHHTSRQHLTRKT